MAATFANEASGQACLHCGSSLERARGPYCCEGCRAVHGLLRSQHLERFYDLRGERGAPIPEMRADRRDRRWLEAIEARRDPRSASASGIELDLQGIHCSACVWLLEKLFTRREGAVRVTINPTLGRARLVVLPSFDLGAWAVEIERFGYIAGPPLKQVPRRSSELAVRMGVCIAIAMNAMIFAIAEYAGLASGATSDLFHHWSIGLSIVSVLVGGSVFFRSAWEGARRGAATLDLPIALGLLLAFVGSLVAYGRDRTSGVFFDTLDVFVALMLVGRYLQERALERNRQTLLEHDGVDGLLTRREEAEGTRTVKCTTIAAGDRLVLAPGDLLPVDARLEDSTSASFSLDWINGESRPHRYSNGGLVPAGAFLAGESSVRLVALDSFERSPLIDLVKTTSPRDLDRPMSTPWWTTVTRIYVALVLVAATLGFVGWLVATGDLGKALEVATAVLVVTCPCAFGIATPLGYELVQAGLRRSGLFVRSASFLDRAENIRTVVFDKTGTLTTGAPELANSELLDGLTMTDRAVLASMVGASHHPKSVAVARALEARGDVLVCAPEVREEAGRGLVLEVAGHTYRLGAPGWAAPADAADADLVFGLDGETLAPLATRETLRRDAATEVEALRASGHEVWLLSGDEPTRASAIAIECGIGAEHAIGGATADAKAAWVAARQKDDLLMIGDGLNDALVSDVAYCSGTPAVDRPFMAARSDFYFVTPGLGCIRLALRAAEKMGTVRRRNLRFALVYNTVAIGLAYAGLMSPLLCAVFMPATSLTTVLATTLSLDARSSLWRS